MAEFFHLSGQLANIINFQQFAWLETVIVTLACVENPSIESSISLDDNIDKPNNDLLSAGDEKYDVVDEAKIGLLDNHGKGTLRNDQAAATSQRPLTSSIGQTLRHLRSLSGSRKNYFRGLGHAVPVAVLKYMLQGLVTFVLVRMFISSDDDESFKADMRNVGAAIAIVLVSGLRASVTHAILSATPRSFFQRFPPVKTWKYLFGPKLFFVISSMILLKSPEAFHNLAMEAFATRTPPTADEPEGSVTFSRAGLCGVRAVTLLSVVAFLAFLYHVSLPAFIVVRRAEAALLPPADETIVPFDATFGGTVGLIGVGDEIDRRTKYIWRSITAADRRRVARMYLKFMCIMLAISVTGVASIYGTILCVSGGDVKNFVLGPIMKLLHH